MQTIVTVLDNAKLIHNLRSDYKLALIMGVQQGSIRNYREGKTLPDARVIQKLCELTGDDPVILAAEIEVQRARTTEARTLWLRVLRRLTAAATVGVVATAVSGCLWVGEAVASPLAAASQSVYYVKYYMQ
jgi:transcriptional regulator with XRE-family HTH domain